MKQRLGLLLLAVFSVFIGFGVIEIVCRLAFYSSVGLIRDPDHHLWGSIEDRNPDGIRTQRTASEFKPGDLNFIVLGDSYVYGLWVPSDFAFPQQFERMANTVEPELNLKVANFGWPSSSPYLSLRLLKKLGKKYNPDTVFLCIDMTDFNDDLKYKHLVERDLAVYRWLDVFPGLITLFKKTLILFRCDRFHEQLFGMPTDHYFAVNGPLARTRPWFAETLAAIEQTHRYVRDVLHSRFILVILPRSFQYSADESPNSWERRAYSIGGPYSKEPFRLFEQLGSKSGYPIYSLLEPFENSGIFPTCFDHDPHWNENGHAVAAEALYDIAVNEGLLQDRRSKE